MATQLEEIGKWDWNYLSTLPQGEFDWLENKKSAWIDNPKWLDEFSYYLSAFSNYEGGYVIIGMKEISPREFEPDEGVLLTHPKNGDLKGWLEDKLPPLVDKPLTRISVQSIPRPDKAERGAIVVYVHPSEQAPHQAADKKFYTRLGSKLRALPTRAIFDIAGRSKNPDLVVTPQVLIRHGKDSCRLILEIKNESDVFCRHYRLKIRFPMKYETMYFIIGDKVHHQELDGKTFLPIVLDPRSPLFPREITRKIYNFTFLDPVRSYGQVSFERSTDSLEISIFADSAPKKTLNWKFKDIYETLDT